MYKRRDFHVLHGEGEDSSSSDGDSDAPGASPSWCRLPRTAHPFALCSAEVSDSEPEEPVSRIRGRLGAFVRFSDAPKAR